MWIITINSDHSLGGIQRFPLVVNEELYILGHLANSWAMNEQTNSCYRTII